MKPNFTLKIALLALLLFTCSQTNAQLNKYYFYNKARKHIMLQEYTSAISTLNTLIESSSNVTEAWYLRGLAKYSLNDMPGALADFSKAIELNPVFSQALLYRGITLSRQKKYLQSNNDFEMVIELRPNWHDGYYSRGVNYLLMGQPKKSIQDFSKVIDLDPKNIDAWINRGTAHVHNADSMRALNDYQKAITLNPFYHEGYSKRGRLLMQMKSFYLAHDDFSKAIELDSTSSINYFFRGLTYSYIDSLNRAIADLNQSIAITPNNALSIYNRALLYWRKGLTGLALDDFTTVAKLNPENVLVYFNRGILHLEMKRYHESINDFTQAIEVFPDFANAYKARANAHLHLNNYHQSKLDNSYAQSIAQKYSNNHNQPLTDTSAVFDKLIAFNSDFTPQSQMPLIDELSNYSIDILPFIRVIALNSSNIDFKNQLFTPIDTLNKKLYKKGYVLSLGTPENSIELPEIITQNNPFLHYMAKGMSYSNTNRYKQAIDYYHQALETSANNPLALINLSAEMADMVNFISTFESNNSKIEFEKQPVKNDKQNSTPYTPLESFEQPIEILNRIVLDSTNQYITLYNKANIYALANQMNTAIELYTEALAVNPKLAEAWYNRGLIYFMQKQNEEGCVDMGKAGELGLKQAYLLIYRFCKR
ncbi:MAG: tetratricopeptide repeat protein [Bacteroidales bacterium]|nr:tetratricopeptide repeat protein [Bacteroidales bacterium]MDD4671694.1 tetratricopeptide repeat protein [Bacteroidales bacterium]